MNITNSICSRIFITLFLISSVQITTHAGTAGPTFGDLVWDDLDGNGIFDINEPGIGGVKIEICAASASYDAVCDNTPPFAVTLSDGSYSLQANYSDIGYFVTVVLSTVPENYIATTLTSKFYDNSTSFIDTADFGFQAAVPVPAAVWLFGSGLLGLIGVARRKRAM